MTHYVLNKSVGSIQQTASSADGHVGKERYRSVVPHMLERGFCMTETDRIEIKKILVAVDG
ncbi:MAG: hypothetical protein ACTSXS_10420, partial [Candidatus Thorarchaeota archaeon]